MGHRIAGQRTLPVLGLADLQRQAVVVGLQQLGHLPDQFILHPLDREAVGVAVEHGEHVVEQRRKIDGQPFARTACFPYPCARPAQGCQPFHLGAAQAAVEHGRDRRQQVAHGVLHTADVWLGDRIAVGTEATCQLALRQRLARLLFVEFAGLLHTQGALNE